MRTPAPRARALLMILVPMLLVPTLAPVGADPGTEAPLFEEGWDSLTLASWRVSGSTVTLDCETGHEGCALRLKPSPSISLSRDLAIPLPPTAVLTYAFRTTDQYEARTQVDVHLGSHTLTVKTVDGYAGRGVSLHAGPAGSHVEFAQWSAPNTWYLLSLYLSPEEGLAWVELHDTQGTLVGGSPSLPLPAEATTLTGLTISATSRETSPLSPYSRTFSYDSFRLARATHDAPLPPNALTGAPGTIGPTPNGREITIQWTPPVHPRDPAVAGYRIQAWNAALSWATGPPRLNVVVPGNVTTFTDLRPIGYWTYRVATVLADGRESAPGAAVWVSTYHQDARPGYVQGIEAFSSPTDVRLEWGSPFLFSIPPVTEYRVYRADPGEPFALIGVIPHVAGTYKYASVDTAAPSGAPQQYAVTAVNRLGEGYPEFVTGAIGAPTAPRNVQATAGDRLVTLTWDPPADEGAGPVTGYLVNAVQGASETNATTSCAASPCDVPFPYNGQEVRFLVRAVNAAAIGAYSEPVDATPMIAHRPRNLTATGGGPAPAVHLRWEPETLTAGFFGPWDAPRAFRVWRSVDGGPWSLIGDVGPETPFFTDAEPVTGALNAYRVTGYYWDGFPFVWGYNGNPSDPVEVPVWATPAPFR